MVVFVGDGNIALGSHERGEVEAVQLSFDVIEYIVEGMGVVLGNIPVPVEVGMSAERSGHQSLSQSCVSDETEAFRSMLVGP